MLKLRTSLSHSVLLLFQPSFETSFFFRRMDGATIQMKFNGNSTCHSFVGSRRSKGTSHHPRPSLLENPYILKSFLSQSLRIESFFFKSKPGQGLQCLIKPTKGHFRIALIEEVLSKDCFELFFVLWTKLQVKQSNVASLSAYACSLIAISKLNIMHHASCGEIHDKCLT